MKLEQILNQIAVKSLTDSKNPEISAIHFDSRRVTKGSLFVALPGKNTNGSLYIAGAIEAGAVAIICEDEIQDSRVTMVRVENARTAMAIAAANFYRHPSRHLKVAAVTGTNGKTTVTFLIQHLCQSAAQWRCGLIGTVRYEIGERILPSLHTSPESPVMQDLLAQMQQAGCKAVALEASSHAIDQHRLDEVETDVSVFTNLTQDHLDYHGTMERYFEVKSRLFKGLSQQKKKTSCAVINIDDSYGARLATRLSKTQRVITYGMSSRADFRAGNFTMDFQGMTYQLTTPDRSFLVRLPLIGRFNIYNALAALAAGSAMGLDLRYAVKALVNAPQIPGRLEAVSVKRSFRVFVDYAHTPDALTNVLKTIGELPYRRLIVVFGCGGDRDRSKRPMMAAAVEAKADFSIVTSDNPRSESPMAIIEEIIEGFRYDHYEVIEDRKEAIFRAIAIAGPKDVVLIAGKGHEDYQEINHQRLPFSDREVVAWALDAKPMEVEI